MTSAHWNAAYNSTEFETRSWSQNLPTESLQFISKFPLSSNDPISDVGGGTSELVDELIEMRFTDLSVLDISSEALQEVRTRLLSKSKDPQVVHWICEDLTQWKPQRTYALWHDRAVFHFLTSRRDQNKYKEVLLNSTISGSYVLIATFSPNGPASCSRLPVTRWSAEDLNVFLADEFMFLEDAQITHNTPWGSTQDFTWASFKRR